MNSIIPLLFLVAGCSMTPYAQETVVTEVVPESEHIPEVKAEPEPKPKAKETKPVPKPKADDLCPPPKKWETEQARIIRKLDCLLER